MGGCDMLRSALLSRGRWGAELQRADRGRVVCYGWRDKRDHDPDQRVRGDAVQRGGIGMDPDQHGGVGEDGANYKREEEGAEGQRGSE